MSFKELFLFFSGPSAMNMAIVNACCLTQLKFTPSSAQSSTGHSDISSKSFWIEIISTSESEIILMCCFVMTTLIIKPHYNVV